MRKSIVFKFFAVISALLAGFLAAASLLFYANLRAAIRSEYDQLNNEALTTLAVYADALLRDLGNISVQLANDSSLIELFCASPGGAEPALVSKVENLVADYSWSREYLGTRFDVYVLGFNGYACSNFYRDKYDLASLAEEPWFERLLAEPDRFVLVDTFRDPAGNGPYQYVFQIAHLVRDHITGENLGVALLNVSEKVLYDCYAQQNTPARTIYLAGGDGRILSAKDKRRIGDAWTELEQARSHNVYRRAVEGTGWELVGLVDPAEVYASITHLRNVGLLICLGLCAVMLAAAHRVASALTRPILALNQKMAQAKSGDLSVRAVVENENEIGQISASFNELVVNMQKLIEDAQREERGKRDMELSFLRAQINPHFIYNTLNSIRFLVEMGRSGEAEEMILSFTKVLRRTLSQPEEFLPLREELDALEDYVRLQSIRYPDRFRVSYRIAPEAGACYIPGFILQPIVENAIFYGTESRQRPCTIRISASLEAGRLRLVVEDDGPGMSPEKARRILKSGGKLNSIGVSNVSERIKLYCGADYGLRVESREGEGTRVEYLLPAAAVEGGGGRAENRGSGR